MAAEKMESFKHRMNTLAYGEAMLAAARDYGKELLDKEEAERAGNRHQDVDVEELLDDPELESLHEQRLAELKEEREKRQQMSHKGHGEVTDITEGEFLGVVTKTRLVACHFFHKDFERCKIMDKHLKILASKYFSTRFCKLHGPDAPFFVAKLRVQTLPCVMLFVDGVAIDRIVGFEELGQKDDFTTETLERRMIASGVIDVVRDVQQKDKDDAQCFESTSVRRGLTHKMASSDEDSDF